MNDNDDIKKNELQNTPEDYYSGDTTTEVAIDSTKDNEDSKPVDAEPIIFSYQVEEKVKSPKKHRGNGFKRIMSYVLVGVFCSAIGGASAVGAIMYIVPNSSIFKDSTLYKSLQWSNSTKYQATAINTSTTNASSLSVADIAKKVGPSVVGVSTKSVVASSSYFGNSNSVQQGMGSGVIFDAKGYIITNYHVIKGATQINIILNNNKVVKAKEINHDETNDIAIIQITDKVDLPGIAELGDSDKVQIGELAVAIGNPLGKNLLGTVTTGIISAVDRQLDSQGVKFLQTDAAINPGNSGGPLINSQGQVIGINSEKIVSSGEAGVSAEGLGFAIPINLVKSKIEGLLKTPIQTPPATASTTTSSLVIGIGIQDIDAATSQQDNKPVGIEVLQVDQDSVGEIAGIEIGDIITKFDGNTVKTSAELSALKAKHKLGDSVKITVNRDGVNKELTLKFIQQN